MSDMSIDTAPIGVAVLLKAIGIGPRSIAIGSSHVLGSGCSGTPGL